MVGDRLKEARGDKTQREVAEAVGISVSTLCMYETENRMPRDDIKEKLASFYHTTVGALFFGE